MTATDREWGERTLKHVACLARRSDVPKLVTGLFMVHFYVICRLLKGTNYYSRHCFVTPKYWKIS